MLLDASFTAAWEQGKIAPSTSFFAPVVLPILLALPRKNPLPKREQDIARRLVEARAKFRCSRADLAELAQVDAQELTRVELGRVGLRYGLAHQIIKFLELNPRWLATGEGDFRLRISIPSAQYLGVPENTPFVEVFDHKLSGYLSPKIGQDTKSRAVVTGKTIKLPSGAYGRRAVLAMLIPLTKRWVIELPDEALEGFYNAISACADQELKKYPRSDWLDIVQRYVDLEEVNKSDSGTERLSKLDSVNASVNSADMKPQWPLLKKRLQKATEPMGLKSKLAAFLGVKLASVSLWLSDSGSQREPGAETTLQMLKWVELQERQAK